MLSHVMFSTNISQNFYNTRINTLQTSLKSIKHAYVWLEGFLIYNFYCHGRLFLILKGRAKFRESPVHKMTLYCFTVSVLFTNPAIYQWAKGNTLILFVFVGRIFEYGNCVANPFLYRYASSIKLYRFVYNKYHKFPLF